MLADCTACDPRNSLPGELYSSVGAGNLYAGAEVDYRARDVNVHSVLQVLTGTHPAGTPPSRRLDTDANSSVLIFMTGHGGDGFLKFHDQSELLAADVAGAVVTMHAHRRYKSLLMVVDTCQAATLYGRLAHVPGWAAMSSSVLGQSSYALRHDPEIGAHLVDELSDHLARFLNALPPQGAAVSLEDMVTWLRQQPMSSTIHVDASRLGRQLRDVLVTEYFGGSSKNQGLRREIKSSTTWPDTVEVDQRNDKISNASMNSSDPPLQHLLVQAWPHR